jgi:hypothetical protein
MAWIYSIIIFSATAKLNKKLSRAGGRFLSRSVSMDTTCFPSGVDNVARDLWTQQPKNLVTNQNTLDTKVTVILSLNIPSWTWVGRSQFIPLHYSYIHFFNLATATILILPAGPPFSFYIKWKWNVDRRNWIFYLYLSDICWGKWHLVNTARYLMGQAMAGWQNSQQMCKYTIYSRI